MEPDQKPDLTEAEVDALADKLISFWDEENTYDAITGILKCNMAGAWASNGPIEWSTSAWNGPIIELDPNDPFGDMERIFHRGIHVTSIVPPESGWPIACYCPICKETTFLLSPWAIKPKEGDYHKMTEVCGSDEHGMDHNLRLGLQKMPCGSLKVNSYPDIIWWQKETK
jgi:hypothetical protein